MARYADDLKVATNLFEAAAWQHTVQVTCRRCQHVTTFDPHALWWLFERKGWNNQFRHAGRRFRCLRCATSDAAISLTKGEPTANRLPMPAPRDWKRALSRFRG